MINTPNSMTAQSSASSSSANPQSSAPLKAHFKTPEGRYKLQYEKTYPSGVLHLFHTKFVSQVTLAQLKDKPSSATSLPTTSASVASGMRTAAARLLGSGNGRTLGFGGGNGGTKHVSGPSRLAPLGASSTSNLTSSPVFYGKGTFLIFNVGDAIFISDLNSQDKDPIKSIHFSNSSPVCHAFDSEALDGDDFLVGMSTGEVYSVSLRQQLQDPGKKLVGARHYNKDGSVSSSRCTSVAWVPKRDGVFVVSHMDGNMYLYEKHKDAASDPSFPIIKDQTQFSVAHARNIKTNPIARWHICQGSINGVAFSNDGVFMATVGRDGYLRVFDFARELLICGGKGYYGALLCCAWSADGKYILAGGEDDLVHIWSMEDRKIVAWGEGHSSFVSGVAFDPFWLSPSSDDGEEETMYRFGTVGQDTQLLLWDLVMDDIVVPLSRSLLSRSQGSGSQSPHANGSYPAAVGSLLPSPKQKDIPKLAPLVAHRVDHEPLSGLIFTRDSVLTACREGHIKIWMRPTASSSVKGQGQLSNGGDAIVKIKEIRSSSNGKVHR
ncbi:hypothetical protein Dimus_007209 [Dionaea muscipula]